MSIPGKQLLTYILRRIALALPTMLIVLTFLFIVMRVLPGDPARSVAGLSASQEDLESLRRSLGLDKPVQAQFLEYLFQLIQGDLGTSYMTAQPVTAEIGSRMGYTVSITLMAMAMAISIGISLGALAAWRSNSLVDVVVSTASIAGMAMPVYWVGLLLILLFSVQLELLPAGGIDGPLSFILPTAALALYPIGVIARMARSALLEVASEDYIRTARSKGLSDGAILVRHSLRNALGPVTTIIGLQLGGLMGGAVLTETVFGWPGIGRLLVDSILNRDTPVVLGVVLFFSLSFILINLATDVLYGVIDPRVRYE